MLYVAEALCANQIQTWCTVQSGVVNKFPFDPLGLDSPTNAEKEIKNGRLAMVGRLGQHTLVRLRSVVSCVYV